MIYQAFLNLYVKYPEAILEFNFEAQGLYAKAKVGQYYS